MIEPGSPVEGRTLGEIDLRGLTGATVLAIRRADAEPCLPTAKDVLRAGDVLALTGSEDAVSLAIALLRTGQEPSGTPPREHVIDRT